MLKFWLLAIAPNYPVNILTGINQRLSGRAAGVFLVTGGKTFGAEGCAPALTFVPAYGIRTLDVSNVVVAVFVALARSACRGAAFGIAFFLSA